MPRPSTEDAMSPAIQMVLRQAAQCQQAGQFEAAERLYQTVLAAEPASVPALVNLALLLCQLERPKEALPFFDTALSLSPGNALVLCCQSAAFRSLGRPAEALAAARGARAAHPESIPAALLEAKSLLDLGLLNDAETAFRGILAQDPHHADAWKGLASACALQDDTLGSIEAYEALERLTPGQVTARLVLAKLKICQWNGIESDRARAMILAPQGKGGGTPFTLLSIPIDPKGQRDLACSWTQRSFGAPPVPIGKRTVTTAPSEKLRLGYLSADFRPHAVPRLAIDMLERHDLNRFDVHAYSYGPLGADPFTRRLLAAFPTHTDLTPFSHEAAAQRIARDGIDILIDLTGYTGTARPQILAARPAPIQVSYLGFPGTMGAGFIDYIIADSYLAPLAQQPYFSEKIVHLPCCYQPSDGRRQATMTSRKAEGLDEDALVLAAFNNTSKITPEMFAIWMRLLATHPKAILWLFAGEPAAENNLRREAQDRGIDPSRLIFSRHAAYDVYLGYLGLADLFLDCFPYNAGATANDALWMGLPILTCSGETYVSRMAGSLLSSLGLSELITHDLADYESKAMALLDAPEHLRSFRRNLETARRNAPLFDMNAYTRHLEAAYTRMAEINQAGDPPRPFVLTP